MRTIGLKPDDRVLVIERRHGGELLHNALTLSMSMDEALRGPAGQMAIEVVMRSPEHWNAGPRFFAMQNVVHISHAMWLAGEVAFAYEELPPQSGVCRFCGCTEGRACVDGNGDRCSWVDAGRTICSSFACLEAAGESLEELIRSGIDLGLPRA